MDILLILVIALLVLGISVTLIGHGIWVAITWLYREFFATKKDTPLESILGRPTPSPAPARCFNCLEALSAVNTFCGICGAHRPSTIEEQLIRELDTTVRQLDRLHKAGALDGEQLESLKTRITTDREKILFPNGRPKKAPLVEKAPAAPTKPTFDRAIRPSTIIPAAVADEAEQPRPAGPARVSMPPPPPPPRRSFPEVLSAFMEQSNIRWGEIIGGLLIIGCSTALVISLWAQISRIPVLKFLIFTTVTAALFAVGFYIEHRWKLPTTSRGILTIATLLVPLNFLAIAAVSSAGAPQGVLLIGSELIAPVLFVCLVYYAGRVITSRWPHLLAAGVLASSIGQLLIRHFAAPDNRPVLLVLLGAFPVVCYAGVTAWMMKVALADSEIDEGESNEIFVTLGAVSFAAILPFSLLLYKSGPLAMSLLHLAPLITLGGTPMLASGTLLWRRVLEPRLSAVRTVGTSIALLGMAVVLAGVLLSWPNPASIVPAALLNFAVFTVIAFLLKLPAAHIFAAACLSLAYAVTVQVLAGHVPWQNLGETSLLQVTSSAGTGKALVIPFLLFAFTNEWLLRKSKPKDAHSYLIAASMVAVASLILLAFYGLGISGDPHHVSIIFALYAAGALWFAWRERAIVLVWAGAGLLLLTSWQVCSSLLLVESPWSATWLLFASICTLTALAVRRTVGAEKQKLFIQPFTICAIGAVFLATVFLLGQMIGKELEPPMLLATRTLWLAAVLLGLVFLTYSAICFNAFQIALVLGGVLLTKGFLQHFDWYSSQANPWLHPWALQTQGMVIALSCLLWIGIREVAGKFDRSSPETEFEAGQKASWTRVLEMMRGLSFSFDQFLAAILVLSFAVITIGCTFRGISAELTNASRTPLPYSLLGFSQQLMFGAGSWLLWLILLTVMAGTLRGPLRREFAFGFLFTLWIICPLVSGRFESQTATASAWRWSSAFFLLGISIIATMRGQWLSLKGQSSLTAEHALVLFLTLTPLLLLTISPVIDEINYVPVRGPQAGTFRAMGALALYSGPLIAAAIALGIQTVQARSAALAFAAGLMVNLTVTVVHIVAVSEVHGAMNRVVLVEFLQLNAIAASCVALLWMATRDWWTSPAAPIRREQFLLVCQMLIAGAFLTLLIVPVALHLIAFPNRSGSGTLAAGQFSSWLALFLALSIGIAWHKVQDRPLKVWLFAAVLLGAASFSAFMLAGFDAARWTGLHALLFALALASWLFVFARDLPRFLGGFFSRVGLMFSADWQRESDFFATFAGLVVALIALRGPLSDPVGAWWSTGALLAMSSLAVSLNWLTCRRVYLYAACILINTSLSIWVLKYYDQNVTNYRVFIQANVVALCIGGIISLILELRARRLVSRLNSKTVSSFHNLAAIASLVAMVLVVGLDLYEDVFGLHQTLIPWLDWLSVVSVASLMIACLWDHEAEFAVAGIYLAGLLSGGLILHHLNLSPDHLAWGFMMIGAVQAIAASLIWRLREPAIAWAGQLRIPRRIDSTVTELLWLNLFNSILVGIVVAFGFWSQLRFVDWSMRGAAAIAVLSQTIALALLAEGTYRRAWQRAAVSTLLIGTVFFGWSFLQPGYSSAWLNRAVILMAAMFGIVAMFGAELDKLIEREPDWTRAFRDCVPVMSGTGIVALAFVLGTEAFHQYQFGAVRVAPLAIATVAITLAAAVVVCIFFPLSPKHDPLSLSESTRGRYVYVAEAMLALLFMHIRLTMPWLFTGFFARYWPLVVVGIAYAGVTVSEMLRRRRVLVLAAPIERTGVLLPLLPVIGFWIIASRVEYSTLLFAVGALYGGLSILRRSFMFGLLAAIAGNGGLWYLLHHTTDYQFWRHPQMWLIPISISVLIAAQLNRKDFSEAQMAGVRYLTLLTIYVSSTADIFINGVAQSPWLPLVLAGLSLAGVFVGMIFRIRAFLLLGSIFLLLAIVTMINFAAVNFGWTWLWYVAGIVTGALIITMFAVFEKKRAEVLRVVDELKDWQK
jgi:hypothetical protein